MTPSSQPERDLGACSAPAGADRRARFADRLFGVPVVATTSEGAGDGHVLSCDAVVLETDTLSVGVQWSETSNTDDFGEEPDPCPL